MADIIKMSHKLVTCVFTQEEWALVIESLGDAASESVDGEHEQKLLTLRDALKPKPWRPRASKKEG